jgi:hypothetical protein
MRTYRITYRLQIVPVLFVTVRLNVIDVVAEVEGTEYDRPTIDYDYPLSYLLLECGHCIGLRDFYQNTGRRRSDPCRRFFNVIVIDVIIIAIIIVVVVARAVYSCN